MSRISNWKPQKTKSKVVFRMQFHATHIPQPGWDKLFISFVSEETGNITAKTTKADVRNGGCKWSDPIYETTTLFHDTRMKKYDEKLYKIAVAMGSCQSDLLGEVNINLAEYVNAVKPFPVSLPLEDCEFGTILHVTVQLLTSKTGFREFKQQRDLGQEGFQKIPDHCIYEPSENDKISAEATYGQTKKADTSIFNTQSRLFPSIEDREDPIVAFDGLPCTTKSIYPEKQTFIISTPGFGNTNIISDGDCRFPLCQTTKSVKEVQNDYCCLAVGSSNLTHGQGSNYNIYNNLTTVHEDANRLKGSFDVTHPSISEFNTEVSSFQILAEKLTEETKSIVQQLAEEHASGEALSKEVSLLKSTCMKFKHELQELKHSSDVLHLHLPNSQSTTIDHFTDDKSTHDLLGLHSRWLQCLNLIEEKVKDIRSKTQLLYHGTGIDSPDGDFQTIDSVLQTLKDVFVSSLGCQHLKRIASTDNQSANLQKISEIIVETDSNDFQQGQMCEIHKELELSKLEQDRLKKNLNQMENYYKGLILELEESHRNTLNELDILKSQHSTCLYTISSFEIEIKDINEDMNGQLSRFADERLSMKSFIKELERRGNASDTMLKKIRHNYSVVVDRLQKELELLSGQVVSLFETNENLLKQAFSEASELLLHGFPGMHLDIGHIAFCNERHLIQDPTRKPTEINGTPLKPCSHMLPPHSEAEFSEMHLLNVNLEIFATVLQETLQEKLCAFRSLIEEKGKLSQKLDDSSQSNELLTVKLQVMTKSVRMLREIEVKHASTIDDLYLRNQILEAKLQDVSHENSLLSERMAECKRFVTESNVFETKYEVCDAKKKELEVLLKRESVEKSHLQGELKSMSEEHEAIKAEYAKYVNDFEDQNLTMEAKLQDISTEKSVLSKQCQSYMMKCNEFETNYQVCDAEKKNIENMFEKESAQRSLLQEELETVIEEYAALKAESCTWFSVIDGLEQTLCLVNGKVGDLWSIIVSCDNQLSELAFTSFSLESKLDKKNYLAIMSQMEQCLQVANKKVLELYQNNKAAEKQINILQGTLHVTECNNRELLTKLDISNALAQKLQLELDEVTEKLKIISEAKNMHEEKSRELSQRNTVMEFDLEFVSSVNRELQFELQDFSEALKIRSDGLTYDEMKYESECCSLSRDCCKKGKAKVQSQLQECNEKRDKLRDAFDLMKHQMEIFVSTADYLKQRNNNTDFGTTSFDFLEEIGSGDSAHTLAIPAIRSISIGDDTSNVFHSGDAKEVDNSISKKSYRSERSDICCGNELENLQKKLNFSQLERMKSQSWASLHLTNVNHIDSEIQCVEKDLLQLNMANQHLENMFPSFKEFHGSKNALEKLLGLEIELAKALLTKKNPHVHFQSSFLRQLNDYRVVFQSFRDINVVIEDTLEMKKNYGLVEAELKEMHNRYCYQSMQFAESEEKRQKLILALKNQKRRGSKG